ncbi:MAG: diaminopimelate epimerase [Oscillospiraceae bacterium]|jgi:diaminopimelate epimerase|nr:diaminopimelate epimerase [Oscillospiraceae bacterium]
MNFTKMQGAGNDYIYVNGFEEHIADPAKAAIQVSDRHFGIGADGLIIILPSSAADFRMAMYNADGSQGKMCGNGTRCIARYVYELGLTDKTEITLETLGGIKTIKINTNADGVFSSATVNMGAPIFTPRDIPADFPGDSAVNVPLSVDGKDWRVTAVSMGNPHCVTFLGESPAGLDLPRIGPAFENHAAFPEQVNTEFCFVHSPMLLEMRVWERGSGETLACGTGACATAAAAIELGHCQMDTDITLRLRGGDLLVRRSSADGCVYMTGPAEFVCKGCIDLNP